MRRASIFTGPMILAGWLAALPSATAAPPESDAYHIVVPRRALAAGEQVELALAPPAPSGVRVTWGSSAGAAALGAGDPDAVYRAPYLIPQGAPPVQVRAFLSGPGIKLTVSTEIDLLPGSIPGAEDCLGPGQSFSPLGAGIEPHYSPLDELPQMIQRVEPEYPPSAWARKIEDTIPTAVLVCRSGRVLDAYALRSYRDLQDPQPVEHDPKLVEAALAAVRQCVFSPGMIAGQPVAAWIHVAVPFRR